MAGKAKVLTQDEIRRVFKELESERNKTIFALGIYTGLRIGEIIRLEQTQVFTDDGVRYLLTVKRLKKRGTVYSDIPLHAKLRQQLKEYRDELNKTHRLFAHFLFPSNQSVTGHLSRQQAQEIFEKAFRSLSFENASTHSMRRSCLTNLNRAGVPLRTVQEISGHSNLGELQGYLDVDPEDKHRAINLLRY